MPKRKYDFGTSGWSYRAGQLSAGALGFMFANIPGAYSGVKSFNSYAARKRLKVDHYNENIARKMEQFPDGVNSAFTKYINLKGRTQYRSTNTMHCRVQNSLHLGLGGEEVPTWGGGSGVPKSGIQAEDLVCCFMNMAEFTKTTAGANTAPISAYTNFFAMNPDAGTTGSRLLESGTTLIPANQWQESDFVNIHKCSAIIDLANLTNNSAFIKFYIAKAKMDTESSPGECWVYHRQAYGQASFGMPAKTESVLPLNTVSDRRIVHTVPQTSSEFNRQWKILGVQSCRLAPGAECKLRFVIKVNRTYSRHAMELKKNYNPDILFPKGCVCIFAVSHGGVVDADPLDTADWDGPTYGQCKIGAICTKSTVIGFVPNRKMTRPDWTTFEQAYNVEHADQKIVSGNIVQDIEQTNTLF